MTHLQEVQGHSRCRFYHHYNRSRTMQVQVPVLLTSKARIHRINFWLSRPFRCQVTRICVRQMDRWTKRQGATSRLRERPMY